MTHDTGVLLCQKGAPREYIHRPGRVRGAASLVAIVDVVVAVNEVVATAAAALPPLASLCDRGIDGIVAH